MASSKFIHQGMTKYPGFSEHEDVDKAQASVITLVIVSTFNPQARSRITMSFLCTICVLASAHLAFGLGLYDEVGFGQFSRVTRETPLSLVEAARNPEIRNSSAFQGFNVTKELGSSFSGTISSSHEWQFQVGYTAANTTDGNAVEIYSYTLDFADEDFEDNRYPLNTSHWQLCTTIYPIEFSSSIAGRAGDAGNASCASYIGDSCTEAWTQAFLSASIDQGTGCRSPPSFSEIDACKNIGEGSGAYTAAVSNATLPSMVRYSTNNSYVDTDTGIVYASIDDLPFQGLTSGQSFAYVLKTGPVDSSATAKNATNLQLLALTIEPNRRRTADLGAYGYSPQARLLCGRASALGEGGGEASSASSLAGSGWLWISSTVAVLVSWAII